MKSSILALALLLSSSALAAMSTESPKLSPSLNEYDNAKLIDENSNRLPIVGVVFPNSSGASGLASVDLQKGLVSQVTAKEGAAMFKLANGKMIPMIALSSIDPGTKLPIPLAIPSSAISGFLPLAGGSMTGAIAMGAHKITGLADPTSAQDAASKNYVDKIVSILSAASAGGAASESLTVSGLLATDTILAVSQSVAGANGTAVSAFGAPGAGSLSVTWTGDPGVGAKVLVLVKHL